jgi:hypothetical protein
MILTMFVGTCNIVTTLGGGAVTTDMLLIGYRTFFVPLLTVTNYNHLQ